MRWKYAVALCALYVCSAGCGTNTKTHDRTLEPGAAPGYKQLHAKIFAPRCASQACHGGTRGVAGLNFNDLQGSYDKLVGGTPVNAQALADGQKLVTKGDAQASFLMHKVADDPSVLTEHGYGAGMPLTGARLGPKSLAALKSWIDAGAPMDGADFEADFVLDPNDVYVKCDAQDPQAMHDCFAPKPAGDDVVRVYSPAIDVPANSEVIMCSYLDYRAPDDLLIKAARGQQMSGGHHIAVFVANSPQSDYTPHECSNTEMENYRFVAGAGGGGGQDTVMPDNTALHIQKGQQIVIQSHYINSTDKPLHVMDAVDLHLVTHPGDDLVVVDPFAMVKSDFSVPAGEQGYRQTTDCTADQDMDIYMLLGHTHDYGTLFEMSLQRDGQEPELLYHATDGPLLRASPEVKMFDPPLHIHAGDTFHMACEWTNTTDHALEWPEEMCVGLMYYGPGRGWLTCSNDDGTPHTLGGDAAGQGCADPSDTGNAMGVGEYCTQNGSECADNDGATFCLAPFDASSNFCSKIGCDTDADCGTDATCVQQTAGSACVPDKCLN